MHRLGEVRAPTLLIVGGHDDVVIDLNRKAARQLTCEHRLEIVPGATHLFEEPGALETVATLAGGLVRSALLCRPSTRERVGVGRSGARAGSCLPTRQGVPEVVITTSADGHPRVTEHVITGAWLARLFRGVDVSIEGTVVTVHGCGWTPARVPG